MKPCTCRCCQGTDVPEDDDAEPDHDRPEEEFEPPGVGWEHPTDSYRY